MARRAPLASFFIALVAASMNAEEASWETAKDWWPRLTNVYTPIGWRDHLFRFNVFYNGMIMADPAPAHASPSLARWRGMGVQLSVGPSERGLDPGRWAAGTYQMTGENGRLWGYQGLLDRPTPVVWTEWRNAFRTTVGYILRQEAFAHVPGGKEVETGDEPIFAWIRLAVTKVHPLFVPEPCGVLIRINKPHWFPEMYAGRNCALRRTDALYPRELVLKKVGPETACRWLVLEPDGRVRLAIVACEATSVTLSLQQGNHQQDAIVHVEAPTKEGDVVDVLLPMVPADRDVVLAELDLGRDGALAECDAYWTREPATAAKIDTPEHEVNELLRRNAQYSRIIAQKMPDGGHYTNLTGSYVYAVMWATPTTMFDTMLLDTLGYHASVDRYLEVFRGTQGSVKPPGPAYTQHEGYLATPKELTSVDWLSDHGAILHAVSYHALVTDDEAFIARWTAPILKACDFVREARKLTDHEGVPGLLPPAVATDRGVATQSVWNLGWHHRGLATAARLLARIGHPRASDIAREAEDFRRVFVRALRKKTAVMKEWTDREGGTHRLVPMSLSSGGDEMHPFYLDTGPLFLVYAGVLNASDPLMRSTLRFFREGPNHDIHDLYGHHEQPAVLLHEVSSCEPCASFNLFHTHQLGDRERFLEGLYGMLTGAHSRQTYIACETRGGITGLVGHIEIYCARLAVIDDLLEPDRLHLLRLVPRSWVTRDRWTVWENVPTVFGPVDLRFRLGSEENRVEVVFRSRFHHAPAEVIVHAPPVPRLDRIVVNGSETTVHPGQEIHVRR